MMRRQQGFTLIELLTVVVTMGVLAGMSIATFKTYRAKAAYGVAVHTLRDARTALEAGLSQPDVTHPTLALTAQTVSGNLSNPTAHALLPGMKLPGQVKFQVSHDSACTGACIAEFIQVNHCQGQEYSSWMRSGDGTEVLLEHISGSGCP